MKIVELRDPEEARNFILQGLWLQRVIAPQAQYLRQALGWALEISSEGIALPSLGFIADLGNIVFGLDQGRQSKHFPDLPGWPHSLARSYEDHFLGKVYSDWLFERATDALRRYSPKEQARGLSYVIRQIRDRGQLSGVDLSPAVLRNLMNSPAEELLAQGYDSMTRLGPLPLLIELYEELVRAARRLAEILGPEDVIAIEQKTALSDLGQYVAHRQIAQMVTTFLAKLPHNPVRPLFGRKEVPTRILDEDHYPVGGYASIATKGSIESLLHSQLAYMEPESPDLFDIKFIRDELFYYSRDENQFLRRRRAFVLALFPDLVATRFKDPELPTQRIVLILATIIALIHKISDWFDQDSLSFELVFVQNSTVHFRTRAEELEALKHVSLAQEAELFTLLLRDHLERGDAELNVVEGAKGVAKFCKTLSKQCQVHCLTISTTPIQVELDDVVVTQLLIPGPKPQLIDANRAGSEVESIDAMDHWLANIVRVLQLWV